jgi:hypothetical protein
MSRNYSLCFGLLGVLLAACGGPLKYDVVSTPRAPGADAHIVATVNESQHQTQLELTVENLAPPERVASSATTYIVWYRTDSGKQWARVAGLNYDADSRSGELKGSVPEIQFEMEISAEDSIEAASPSPHIVFAQTIGSDS